MKLLIVGPALVVACAAFAVDSEEEARIERDLDKAKAEVSKKYGDRKTEELSSEERRQKAREESEAAKGVLEKHGTDAKSYERSRQKMNQETQKDVRARADAMKAKEEADAKKPANEGGVEIQRGLSDEEEAKLADEQLKASGSGKAMGKGKRRR